MATAYETNSIKQQ